MKTKFIFSGKMCNMTMDCKKSVMIVRISNYLNITQEIFSCNYTLKYWCHLNHKTTVLQKILRLSCESAKVKFLKIFIFC